LAVLLAANAHHVSAILLLELHVVLCVLMLVVMVLKHIFVFYVSINTDFLKEFERGLVVVAVGYLPHRASDIPETSFPIDWHTIEGALHKLDYRTEALVLVCIEVKAELEGLLCDLPNLVQLPPGELSNLSFVAEFTNCTEGLLVIDLGLVSVYL